MLDMQTPVTHRAPSVKTGAHEHIHGNTGHYNIPVQTVIVGSHMLERHTCDCASVDPFINRSALRTKPLLKAC